MSLSKESIICQSRDIDATDIDGEKVMMDLDAGKYFSLNPVGSRIWEIISEKQSVNDVIQKLLSEYDVEEKECEESVVSYLEILKNANLIEESEEV